MATSIDSSLIAMVKPHLPGCSDGLIVLKGREIAEDFCRRSTALRGDLPSFETVADQKQYTLTHPDGAIIGAITKIEIDEVEIHHSRYSFDSVLEFNTAPTESGKSVIVSIVSFITPNGGSYPDDITYYLRAIANGTLAALKNDSVSASDPAKWYDPAGAARYNQRYEDAIFRAHNEVIAKNKSNPVMANIPYFA